MASRTSSRKRQSSSASGPNTEPPPLFIVTVHKHAHCGCGDFNGTIGVFGTFDEARIALREAVESEGSEDVYEEAYIGPESQRESCIKALREGREGSEEQFDFSLCDTRSFSWTETWNAVRGSATIEIKVEPEGCSSDSTYTIQSSIVSKKTRKEIPARKQAAAESRGSGKPPAPGPSGSAAAGSGPGGNRPNREDSGSCVCS